MDTDGYEIHRYWLDSTSIPDMSTVKTEPIFNDNPHAPSDKKRRQATVRTAWTDSLRRRLAKEYPRLIPSPVILIESLPWCQRQAAHCDYVPSPELAEANPLLFLLALEPDTRLDVWSGSHVKGGRPCRRRTLRLDAGDAVFFRADLVHAGSAYEKSNRRLHIYLDSPIVPRRPNRTWVIYKHADRAMQERIVE